MIKVTKEMSIGQILDLDRRTAPIFFEYGMHCLGCPMSARESLEEACAVHGTDVNGLVDALNEFFEDNTI